MVLRQSIQIYKVPEETDIKLLRYMQNDDRFLVMGEFSNGADDATYRFGGNFEGHTFAITGVIGNPRMNIAMGGEHPRTKLVRLEKYVKEDIGLDLDSLKDREPERRTSN